MEQTNFMTTATTGFTYDGVFYPATWPQWYNDICDLCDGRGYYRDFSGVWHKCPKCNGNTMPYKVTCEGINPDYVRYVDGTNTVVSVDIGHEGAEKSIVKELKQ